METQQIVSTYSSEAISNSESDVNDQQDVTQILRLRVKLIDDRVFQVEAERGFTVLDFRGKVAQVTEIPIHLQRLIYRGKLLKDGTLLSNYDIQDGHTVHLVAKRVTPSSTNALPSSSTHETETTTTEHSRLTREYLSNGESAYLDQGLHRSRARLRQLLRSTSETVNTLNNPSTLRGPSVLRPQVTTRSRVPGVGDPTGDAWNIAVLREAMDRTQRGDSNTDISSGLESSSQPSTGEPPILPSIRGLFGDQERHQMAQHDVPASVSADPNASTVNEALPNLDHIVQGIMMVQTVLSTATPGADHTEGSTTGQSHHRFFIGQWLDVQDTVNQWLESTVMDIADGKVLIHYHGWPSRWDEWLDMDSHRIAAFRTRTTQVLNPHQLSPSPMTRSPNAPQVQSQNIQQVVPHLRDLMRQVLPQMEILAALCERQTTQTSLADGEESNSNVDDELSEMAHLISPVLDRFGRLLTDSARQLDPLLRSELQREERDRRLLRHPVRPAGATVQEERSDENTNLRSMRDLIVTSTPPPVDPFTPPRRNIDVHIHAIISPSSVSSLASLARLGSVIAGAVGDARGSNRQPALDAPVSTDLNDVFGSPMQRPLQPGTEGRSLLNDFADFDSLNGNNSTVDDSRIPLLSEFQRSDENGTVSRRTRPTSINNYMSFSQDSDNLDDPVDGERDSGIDDDLIESRRYQRILSPQSHIPMLEDDEVVTDVPRIGIIPEIAAAAEQERQRRDQSTDTRASTPVPASPFPTFLQVLRRTLSGVRGLVNSPRTNDDDGNEQHESSSSVEEASVAPATTTTRSSRETSSASISSSIEEDFDSVD